MENKMLELLKTRRSVRAYKPEQIQAQELDAVLEAGTYAPTGMGMQSPGVVAGARPPPPFPAPPPAAGHPKIFPAPDKPLSCKYCFTPMAAASEPPPSRLCPQPWPGPSSCIACFSVQPACWLSPGRASNSPRKAITGPS